MSREPTDTVQINLRIKEAARARFAAAAERDGLSMNAEILMLAEHALRQPAMLEADRLAENVKRYLEPLLKDVHELAKTNDVISLTDALIERVQPLLAVGVIDGPGAHEIREIVDKYSVVKNMFAIELASRAREIHTHTRLPGAKP